MTLRHLLVALAIMVVAMGCGSRPAERRGASRTEADATERLIAQVNSLERPTCRSPSPTFAWGGDRRAPEIRGFSRRGTLWALVFLPRGGEWAHPTRAVFTGVRGKQVKIVWRVTGIRHVSFVARSPTGRADRPRWGPNPHDGSTWERPGREWGTGFVFRETGCWRIGVSGAQLQGFVVLIVR